MNNKDDESKCGMCNRFCPWAPCADPPVKVPEMDKSLLNPMTLEQQGKSLFGKKSALAAAADSELARTEGKAGENGGGAPPPPQQMPPISLPGRRRRGP